MLKTVTYLEAKDVEMLISFVNLPVGQTLMETIDKLTQYLKDDNIKYEELLDIALSNKGNKVKIDVSENYEQIVFEAYDIYFHLKDILEEAHRQYPNIEGLTMMFEFIPFYENLLKTSKFSQANTRSIQKMYLEKILKEEIEKENYAYCSELQKTIKEI